MSLDWLKRIFVAVQELLPKAQLTRKPSANHPTAIGKINLDSSSTSPCSDRM
jgi:hypothetical protein